MAIYLALGSSFASGPGIDPIIDAGCGRPGNSYAHLLAARLGYHLIDVSSGGAAVRPIPTVRRQKARAFFGTPVDRGAVDAALGALPGKVAGLVNAIRAHAPRVRVVLVDYLTVVPEAVAPLRCR